MKPIPPILPLNLTSAVSKRNLLLSNTYRALKHFKWEVDQIRQPRTITMCLFPTSNSLLKSKAKLFLPPVLRSFLQRSEKKRKAMM